MVIRPARREDVAGVAALYVELKRHHARIQPDNPRYKVAEERWGEIALAAIENDEEVVLVADSGEEIVGFVRLSFGRKPWGRSTRSLSRRASGAKEWAAP